MGELQKFSYNIFREHMETIRKYPRFLFFGKKFFLAILKMKNLGKRYFGHFCFEDRIDTACYYVPPMVFLKWGCLIAHPFGITLSADEIGADCQFTQNVTIGTNSRDITVCGGTWGYHPKIDNLVHFYPGAAISGNITIADNTIIAANAFVDRDVPANSVVDGVNKISPLKLHQINSLANRMRHVKNVYQLITGLVYKNHALFIDREWIRNRYAELNDFLSCADPSQCVLSDM